MHKNTISVMVGKGSLKHNSRVFYAENVDPSRSHLNIEYCNENIKDVYHELFDDALARYNAKQKRSDRKIENYYEKICSGKQEKLFHELVIQIGNRDTCAAATDDGAYAARLLDEYMQGFQTRNPTLRVFSAHLHMELSQVNQELTEVHRETAQAKVEKENALQVAATAKKAAEEAEAVKEESQKKANSLKAYIQSFERNVYEYDEAKKWQLPEPDFLMGAGTYREKKALPLVNKLKNVIKNLTLQLIYALEANDRLKQSLKKSDQKIDHLRNRVSKLEERNNILDERSHRLELVEHAVGEEQVNRIADEQSRREEWERNQRKRQRGRAEWSL